MYDELTKQDIAKIQEEIDHRKLVVRHEALEALKEARAQGDLSENFEYYAAKRDKNKNESRIRYLERMIKTAKVIDRYGNEKEIFYESDLVAPAGEFTAQLQSRSLNGNDARAVLTIGFTGKEIANEK